MPQKRRQVKELAYEAGLDNDAALVALWDAGFGKLLSPNDWVRGQGLSRARRALGLGTRRELETPDYWMKLLKLQEPGFQELLDECDVDVDSDSGKLRPKAISRLRTKARERGVDPITGNPLSGSACIGEKAGPPFTWRSPGHQRELRRLSADEVRAIHFELVKDFQSSPDPIMPPGVRSESLLASAVFRPQTSLGDTLKYPTVETSAAALLHSIILDHPFHNGNKRTALVATLVFLDENNFFPDFPQDEVFKLVLQVAQHRVTDGFADNLPDREVLAIADWLCDHCRFLEQGNRQIPIRKLRRVLVKYGCRIYRPVGNKLDIARDITSQNIFQRIFGRRKVTRLRTHLPYNGEGRDVSKTTISRIRQDLQLDDLHGIDSHAFYSMEAMKPADFIMYYRKTLYRLAKF